MFVTILRKIHRLSRRLWVRVTLISGLAFVALGAAKLFGPMIPDGLSEMIGADALNRLLDIISTSMLAVTTFSLSVMVSVHQSASSKWTPRAHRMLLADTTTQTVLATFIGAYIYSLAAIILLSTPYYGEKEVVTLYLATLAVLVLIVFVILRWILHLQALGSLVDTTARIEREALRSFRARMERPCLGGHALDPGDIPAAARPIRARRTAYVQAIYEDSLQKAAEEQGGQVYVDAPVGRFVHEGEPIAHILGGGDALEEAVRAAIHMGELRTAEQDPRFGLIMLSEIGSKALSAGINDPGTAIDVIGRIGRVIGSYRDEIGHGREEAIHDRLWVVPLAPRDLMQDGFGAMARDGAAQVEVLVAMLKALAALQRHPDAAIASAAHDMAGEAMARGRAAIDFGPDRDRLARAAPEAAARR
ncbi:DUF2254 domain-containing protein [Limimaricola hongkongensis]|uniref:DUF2254 domain-containing protein n=1 Tax=Limimaricola hongkongensis DSM 17492 TaxID=1122180 RepID=A0A017HBU3_9RHOB|nr:DUF2254 domain-containing protein [Limimaricola hongkongensis]EYD71851.1 hypothetical protein Lokhon_01922 [Limimaricola hongkongensis DSM 17492]